MQSNAPRATALRAKMEQVQLRGGTIVEEPSLQKNTTLGMCYYFTVRYPWYGSYAYVEYGVTPEGRVFEVK